MPTRFRLSNTNCDISGFKLMTLLQPTTSSSNASCNTATTASGTTIQVTQTSGGTALAWMTPPLKALVLTGLISVRIWGRQAATGTNSGWKIQLSQYNASNGVESNIGVMTANATELTTSYTARTINVSATGVNIADRDRLILRIYANNIGTMGAGWNRISLNGATSEANGDTYMHVANTCNLVNKYRHSKSG